MGEKVKKTVQRIQKWSVQNPHWIILTVVAVNIPDVLSSSNDKEPVRYWLSWFLIVTGIATLISVSCTKGNSPERRLSRRKTRASISINDIPHPSNPAIDSLSINH